MREIVENRTVRTSWLPGISAGLLMLLMSFTNDKSVIVRILQSVFVGAVVGIVSFFSARGTGGNE